MRITDCVYAILKEKIKECIWVLYLVIIACQQVLLRLPKRLEPKNIRNISVFQQQLLPLIDV